MRIKNIVGIAGVLLAALPGLNAATTLTAWTFDNLSTGANGSPQPSTSVTGSGSASALGMANSYNNTNSLSNPDIEAALAGNSSGGVNAWRIRGGGTAPNGGNGWSTNAPIGSQGATFAGSTAGYYRVMLSFDVYATADAEANLQIQYTTEGITWYNATNITLGGAGTLNYNADTNQSTVLGAYVTLASGWNNQITVDFSGISGVDNNPNFAVRIVNASTGTNCVDATGASYNNTSGSWAFDNVVIKGVNIDTISAWTFESYGTTGYVPHPVPEFSVGNASYATALGFDTSFHFADGSVGSTNAPDTLVQAGSSTSTGPICWRVRGQGPGNGWDTQSPIGSQGAEFDVSTLNFSNIVVTFDLYFTTQAEAKMQVEYTTDGMTWNNAPTLAYGAKPEFIQTNSLSSDTVMGTYFYETTGQNWYNNLVVDFTGVAGADNNPNFGIRIVNAAQNNDCVAFNGFSYNNSSGNCRYDNVAVGGQFNGSVPPVVTPAITATVDAPFTNTFTDLPNWRTNLASIFVNGSVLTNSAYTTNTAGMIIFTPSKSALLQSSGSKTIVFNASGYSSVKVVQVLGAGVATKLALPVQAAAPSASGGTLAVNPVVAITDQYGNTTTNPYANVVVTAAVGGTGKWTLGGDKVQPSINGVAAFTNLTATVNGTSALGATNYITFTVTGYGATATNFNSANFSIGAPPVYFTPGNLAVLQVDTLSNNTTFSMIEIKPSVQGQTAPANIVPITATGTNALRQAPSGSTGRLALSGDATLLCFAAFADNSAATADETLNLSRAAGSLNSSNQLNLPMTYTSISLGGSQARAACTVDGVNWIVDDKGGLYYGSGYIANPNINALNNVVVKTFGGNAYVETQKTANGSPIPVVYMLDSGLNTIANNLGTDPIACDFYLISTNGGASYDIMYIADQGSSSVGIIKKYSWVNGADPVNGYGWGFNGAFTNGTGIDGLFAATNGSGQVCLFYTSGSGGTGGNSIYRVTDGAGWNQNISIVSSNLLYTSAKTVSLKGLTFTPLAVSTNEPTPPPVLVTQTGASVNAAFAITNSPDDPAWRSAITAITVNGTALSASAYDKTQSGLIVFDPSKSALLQTSGNKTIVITATGYSTNSVTQALVAGPATQMTITTQPTAPVADGAALAHEPVVKLQDAYGNLVAGASVTAAAVQTTWGLRGTLTVPTTNGLATYSGLTAFSTNAVTGATISFASGSLSATSSAFNIPAPIKAVLGGVKAASGKASFSFTTSTGLSYSVYATNLLTAPLATWPLLGQAVESPAGSGTYTFTNATAASSMLFYSVRQQ